MYYIQTKGDLHVYKDRLFILLLVPNINKFAETKSNKLEGVRIGWKLSLCLTFLIFKHILFLAAWHSSYIKFGSKIVSSSKMRSSLKLRVFVKKNVNLYFFLFYTNKLINANHNSVIYLIFPIACQRPFVILYTRYSSFI